MSNILTIFSTPRPFEGPFDLIQRNAIKSWIKTCPGCEIILFEDEEKTTGIVAKEFGVRCVLDVERDEFGTPLLSDVYKKAKEIADSVVVVHINTDIILTDSFFQAIKQVLSIMKGKPFFMSGRRWDLDVDYAINFDDIDWQEKIKKAVKKYEKENPERNGRRRTRVMTRKAFRRCKYIKVSSR